MLEKPIYILAEEWHIFSIHRKDVPFYIICNDSEPRQFLEKASGLTCQNECFFENFFGEKPQRGNTECFRAWL